MNRIILMGIFILLSGFSVFAQKFSIDDLRKFNNMSMGTFKTTIKETYNYSLYDKTESERFVLFEYDSRDFKRKIGKFDYIKEKELNSIEYHTVDRKEFEEIKSNMLKLKYKVTGTGKLPGLGETYLDYKLDDLEIRLITPKKGANLNDPFTVIVFK